MTSHRQVTAYVLVLKALDSKSLQQLLDRALALLPPHGQHLVTGRTSSDSSLSVVSSCVAL